MEDETVIPLFANCLKSKTWYSLKEVFEDTIHIPLLTPQSTIFRFKQIDQEF